MIRGAKSLDTVLGLSMTRSRMGWVLVEGQDADGVTLDRDEFAMRTAGGLRAVDNAEQATAAVMQTRALVDARAQRLHAVGVTWSDDAAAEAALLVESLTGAGFDNVVPVRRPRAADAPTRGMAPVLGSEKTAACLLEDDLATLVMAGDCDAQADAMQTTADDDGLIRWLTETFEQPDWNPDGLVVAGSRTATNLGEIAQRLENSLGIKVLVRSDAQLALARGAALASTPSAEFPGVPPVEMPDDRVAGSGRSRWPLAFASGATMLVAGAMMFVTSVSVALGLHFAGDNGRGSAPDKTTPSVTRGVAERPVHPPRPPRVEPVREPVANPPAPPEASETPPGPPPMAGLPEDVASDEPAPEATAPDEPAPEEMASEASVPEEPPEEAPPPLLQLPALPPLFPPPPPEAQ